MFVPNPEKLKEFNETAKELKDSKQKVNSLQSNQNVLVDEMTDGLLEYLKPLPVWVILQSATTLAVLETEDSQLMTFAEALEKKRRDQLICPLFLLRSSEF